MSKLKNLKSFLDFDHNAWIEKTNAQPEPEPTDFDFVANEDQRLNQAFTNALGNKKSKSKSNPFDDDKDAEKQKSDQKSKNVFDKPKSNGLKDRVKSVGKDARRALWKGYKHEVSPFWQKTHKYIFNREV